MSDNQDSWEYKYDEEGVRRAVRGLMRNQATRAEAMSLINS